MNSNIWIWPARSSRLRQGAFSLIELLIVVFIAGIIAVIAVPSYLDSVRAAGRAEAKTGLFAVASDLQRYFSNFNTYIDDAQPLSSPAEAGRLRQTQTGLYSIAVTACEGGVIRDCFLATATPQGAQALDACSEFSMDSRGRRMAESETLSADECWNR